ncbi:hypothetical protein BDA99DRAFT_510044 [Phascolomyces articulosus]|uniref:Uncharacterized protein n=1 Tax=Phascolomyces articulosus TaxID=60185 RepID=A0AAD5KAL4_9FUNG|nr:hypothetical protein BDA99DRAFT_510044 [Phascolomyces articulosus]
MHCPCITTLMMTLMAIILGFSFLTVVTQGNPLPDDGNETLKLLLPRDTIHYEGNCSDTQKGRGCNDITKKINKNGATAAACSCPLSEGSNKRWG